MSSRQNESDTKRFIFRIENLRKIAKKYVENKENLSQEDLYDLFNAGIDLRTINIWF